MTSPGGIDFGTLCEELSGLINAPQGRDDASRAYVESRLTDGYASAMSLEAERLRIERRIGEVAGQVSVRNRGAKTEELEALSLRLRRASDDLKHLRGLLSALRQRVSAAA